MLLRVIAAKPRSCAIASRSNGKPLPASAPEPSGRTLTRCARLARAAPNRARTSRSRPAGSAARGRPARGAYACSRGSPRRDTRAASSSSVAMTCRESALRTRSHLVAQPEARVERDLLVAAAAGMDLVGKLAGSLLQLADDERMDVLIGRAVEERGCRLPRRSRRRRRRAASTSSAVRMPTRPSARANACDPRISASNQASCRNGASPRSARRPPTGPSRTVRPKASYW